MAIRRKIEFIIAIHTIFFALSYGQSPSVGTVCAESRHQYGVDGMPGSTFAWAVEQNSDGGGMIVSGGDNDTILIEWGYATGEYLMEVVEMSAAGCEGVPVTATVTVQAPEVNLGFDFYEQCDGDSLVLDATGSYQGVPTFLWHDGSTQSFYVADTTENIWVLVTDGDGCTRTDSVDVTTHGLPTVYLGSDTILCDLENPLRLDAGDFSYYEWFSSNEGDFIGNPIYVFPTFDLTDTIRVTVTDYNQCKNSDTVLVFVCDAGRLFADMINTFVPESNEEENRNWRILKDDGMINFPDAVLEVFDRWGRLVYRTENVYNEPWDGTSNGRPMPMDAYFFVLELNFGGFEPITGTVNLIR